MSPSKALPRLLIIAGLVAYAVNRHNKAIIARQSKRIAEMETELSLDSLTGLHNRRYLLNWLDARIATALDTTTLSLVMIDLDHFKSVNDQRGHLAGDRELQRVAAQLTEQVEYPNLASRFGGDEFCVVLLNSDAAETERAMDRLKASLAEGGRSMSGEYLESINFCSGIADFPQDAVTAHELIRLADLRLCRAKLERFGRPKENQSFGLKRLA